ncbi:MAG: hypothetical protein ACLGG6_01970 [Gammaproteobacteria bacterium]
MQRVCLPFLLLPLLTAGPAFAGPYSDDLGKCLVASTTAADKGALVKWMFATAALHPAVKSIASVTPAERTGFNRGTARLFERLVTESCKAQTQQAVKYEGAVALQVAFQLLGQVAARELFADPAVAGGMAELERHFDKQKLEAVLGAAP